MAKTYNSKCLCFEPFGRILSALIKFRSLEPCNRPTLPINNRAIIHCISPLKREQIKTIPVVYKILEILIFLAKFKI